MDSMPPEAPTATPPPTAIPNPNLEVGDPVMFRRPVDAYPDQVSGGCAVRGEQIVLKAGSGGVVIVAAPKMCSVQQGGLYQVEVADETRWWVYGGDITPKVTAEDASASLPTPTPTPVITAGELLAAFEDNALAATRDYEGKILLVSGTIEAIDREFDGTPFIGLTSSSGPIQFTEVKCLFSEEHISEILSLSSGAGITLRGKFSEFALFDIVLLTDCRVSTL